MSKQLDWSKPIQTRDGRKARLLGEVNNPAYTYPVYVVILENGQENVRCVTKDGLMVLDMDRPSDIINTPTRIKREVWVNVYETCVSRGYESEEKAKQCGDTDCLARIKHTIDCAEGDGL